MSHGTPTPLPADARGRYREILPDWEAFERALRQPPPCILAHPGRGDRTALAGLLAGLGVASEPVRWQPGALRLGEGARPGLLWPLRAGLYQIQEEASLLPVELLAPRPGERVLDLCAAPGGKTAQIAVALGLRGTVVANDRNERRLSALREKAKRWGLLNVATTVHDGGAYPLAAGPFDRVLVDAPCSAERRATPPRSSGATLERFRQRIASAQRALLRRALALCRPGGRVVYSTCSLAPEENEAVVDAVLREKAVSARVLPLCVPGLPHSPGLVAWAGASFHPSLRHALRLWPHRARTGGFFAVALECTRAQRDPAEAAAAVLEPPDGGQRARAEAFVRRFGLPPDTLSRLRLVRRGRRWLHAVAPDHRPPAEPEPRFLGIPLFKLDARQPKPTTAAALLLGRGATRNIVEVDGAQLAATLSGRAFAPRSEQLERCAGHGFVILRHRDIPLGAGLLAERDGLLVVESQVPRAWVPEREL